MNYHDLIILGISFGLGLLVGLQREKTDHKVAGVRTFTLIALLGTMTGFITREFDNPYVLPVIGLCITAIFIMANYMRIVEEPKPSVGQTTEVAILLMFVIGAYLVLGSRLIGVIVGGSLAILLYVKEILHDFIDRLKDKHLSAIMTFVGISLVILPILPNKTFGPYKVLNPQNIWLMVVLIVGISILGYFIYKYLGKEKGMISNGILGGIISSTATTVSYSKTAKQNETLSKFSAFVILTAATVSIIRVVIEMGVVAPKNLKDLAGPFVVLFVLMALLSLNLFYKISGEKIDDEMPEPKNVAQFKSALSFGVLYGLILLAVAFVKDQFGDSLLYIVSIIGGLVKKDAITLSLAYSVKHGFDVALGWRLIMAGVLANFAFQMVLIVVLAGRRLAKTLTLYLSISIIAGICLILFWP